MANSKRRYALESLFGPGRPEMVGYVPHAQHLGIRVVETGAGRGICMLPYRDELIGDPVRKVVFGGAITTLIDHASGLAVACALDQLTSIATIDLRVDYLRAAAPGQDLYTRSECYRVTRNVAFVRAVAYEETADDPLRELPGTFMLGANRSDNPFERLVGGEGCAGIMSQVLAAIPYARFLGVARRAGRRAARVRAAVSATRSSAMRGCRPCTAASWAHFWS